MSNAYLKPGDTAPQFCLPGEHKRKATFECLKDVKSDYVVVYFYPEDNTPGCTIQAKEFSENIHRFEKEGGSVIGISPDSPQKHIDFCNKHYLKLDLLSDEGHNILKRYGVWEEKKRGLFSSVYGVRRSTYLINGDGRIRFIWRDVEPKGHARKVLDKIKELKNK